MLRERLADIEATPFDGCVFHVEYRVGKRRNNLAWRAWGREAIPAAAVEPALRDLRALRPRRLRHNSLRFNVTPGDVDWFDDFQPVLSNARLAARLAREGGAVGIVLDTEQYEGQLFDYVRQRDADSRSYDEYAAQVRKRGRELIAAFQSEHPSLALLMTFSYSLPWRDAQRTGKPLAELSYGMLAPFVDGLVDGTVGARLIDGYEMSYGYRSRREFDMAYARMSAGVLPLVADPARYRAVTTFAFGLWMDYDSRIHTWDPRNVGANYFSPESFERSVRWALETTDEYVWIYTQQPRWWTDDGGRRDLPPAYEEAIRRARRRANPRR